MLPPHRAVINVKSRQPHQTDHRNTLLLTSDGITEARRGKEFLEVAGLMKLVREAHPLGGLEQTAQSILAGARTFGGGSFRDDVCLPMVRRLCGTFKGFTATT